MFIPLINSTHIGKENPFLYYLNENIRLGTLFDIHLISIMFIALLLVVLSVRDILMKVIDKICSCGLPCI